MVLDHEAAIAAIIGIAEHVFAFYPFEPDPFPAEWRDILRCWLLGQPLAAMVAGQEAETLQFIEGGLVYRLPWAMEALRVRAAANGDVVGVFDIALEHHELGLAVPAVETGTINRSASILIQAGFNSRLAAIKAVADTAATFTGGGECQLAPLARPRGLVWPDPIGQRLKRGPCGSNSLRSSRGQQPNWARRATLGNVQWFAAPVPPGSPVGLHHRNEQPLVLAPKGKRSDY